MSTRLHNPKSHAPAIFIPCWLAQVPTSELNISAKVVYGRLAQWATAKGTAHRSASKLSEETGIPTRTVEFSIKELKEKGLIGTYRAVVGGHNYFEFYHHKWMDEPIVNSLCYKSDDVPPSATIAVPPATIAEHKIKEIKVTNKNKKEKEKEKETEKLMVFDQKSKTAPQHQPATVVKSPPQKPIDGDTMSYPEVLYPMPTVATQLGGTEAELRSQYGLTKAQEAEFEIFWDMYPSKKNKGRVRVLWYASGCHLIASTILPKLQEQIDKDSHFLGGYHPSAANYVIGRRWEDGLEPPKKKNKGSASHLDEQLASTDWRFPISPLTTNSTNEKPSKLDALLSDTSWRFCKD